MLIGELSIIVAVCYFSGQGSYEAFRARYIDVVK